MNEIIEFGKAHAGAIAISFAWFVREWSTFGGWRGLRSWFMSGQTKPMADHEDAIDRVNKDLASPPKP